MGGVGPAVGSAAGAAPPGEGATVGEAGDGAAATCGVTAFAVTTWAVTCPAASAPAGGTTSPSAIVATRPMSGVDRRDLSKLIFAMELLQRELATAKLGGRISSAQARGRAKKATAEKWATAAAITSRWKTSW